MSELSATGETPTGSRTSTRWGAVLVVCVALVGGGLWALHATRHVNHWLATYESSDAAAVNQDNRTLVGDLALAPGTAVAQLRYDCQIGVRDTARVLSHPQSSDPVLRRTYRAALLQDAATFATCVRDVAVSSSVPVEAALTAIRQGLNGFDTAAALANARAQHLGYGTPFATQH